MEELKHLLRDEKELIIMLEDHLRTLGHTLENIGGMRQDFQELFAMLKLFVQKQEIFMQSFIDKDK